MSKIRDEEPIKPELQRRVNSDGVDKYHHGPMPSAERITRWVCHVCEPSGARIATGILVGPDSVLTPFHVVEGNLESLSGFTFLFDDIQDPKRQKAPTLTQVSPAATPPVFSEASEFDQGKSKEIPSEEKLDFVLVRLDREIGKELLEDGEKRGWVSLENCAKVPARGSVVLLHHPGSQPLQDSRGKLVSGRIPNRCHYTANSDPGSSGGLLYLNSDNPLPLAMHLGGPREINGDMTNFGVPLVDVIESITRGGDFENPTRDITANLEALNICVLCGKSDSGTTLSVLKDLFTSPEVVDSFRRRKHRIHINGIEVENITDDCVFDFAEGGFSLEELHESAQSDIALLILSRSDIQDAEIRDRLLTAYGYLIARLGNRRVHLIYPKDARLNHVYLANQREFMHRYEEDILEICSRFETIAKVTFEEAEDTIQGLFELVQVALPELSDERIFREPDFGANNTLHIIGIRFLRLGAQLPKLFDALSTNPSKPRLIIAFPGAEISESNPYLLESLQAGGQDTIRFMQDTRDLLRQQKYDRSFLERVTYFAMNDIPTFILTAADLDYPEGRMLIAPAFRAPINGDERARKPRLVVQNKLSEHGIYDAYRRIVLEFLDEKQPGNKLWTLDNFDATEAYIERLQGLKKDRP